MKKTYNININKTLLRCFFTALFYFSIFALFKKQTLFESIEKLRQRFR